MNIRNLKIRSRLALGFGSMIILMLLLGFFTQTQIMQLSGLTDKLYKHPFTVSTSMLRINGNIVKMHRSMKDVALAKNTQQMDAAAAKVSELERDVIEDFKMVEERFLGDKSRVYEARDLFVNWKSIRDEVIQHMRLGEREQAAEITKAKGARHVGELMKATQYLIDYAFDKADTFMNNAGVVRDSSINVAYAVMIISVIVALILATFITGSIVRPVNAALSVARKVAKGDLSGDIKVETTDEMGQLLSALSEMNRDLYKIVGTVKENTSLIYTGSEQISAGNMSLSQRTEEQASSLEETASSMEEMTSTVKQNADNADQASQLAQTARDQAEAGGQVVSQAVTAMGEINQSSSKIADIISVVEEIAFQTNLLALNAAVEAARAGEQGRGFAVVASEVRVLAGRSADAAKEIKSLIEDSVGKVKAGSDLVDKSGETLQEIVTGVKKVTDIVFEIAAASQEQSSGIDQVNKAITQMDEMTQMNASLVEEAASASKSMEEQARQLSESMSFFKLGDGFENTRLASSAQPTIQHRTETLVREAPVKQVQHQPEIKAVAKKTGTSDGSWEDF